MTDAQLPSSAPYGVEPRRSRLPLLLCGTLYVAWFGFLLWLAMRSAAH